MSIPPSKIQLDFDRIADLPEAAWNHNDHYARFLLEQLPASSDMDALEIGCGTGRFTRLLASRYRRVLALDLSPHMIERAREQSREYSNIEYCVADALTYPLASRQFGCVASVATLHHLPLDQILSIMREALGLNGTLLALDLFRAESLADLCASAVAVPVNLLFNLIRNGRVSEPAEVRAAWVEHGRTDEYLSLAQVRKICAAILPGARINRLLLWRYSIIWKKE